jgi:hypothetical protein
MNSWNELRDRLRKQETIDKDLQRQIIKGERTHETSFIQNSCHREISG